MPETPERAAPLAMSRLVLRTLIVLNVAAGVLILALFVASVIWGGPVMYALGVRPAPTSGAMIASMRGIMVVGVMATPLTHVVFSRLLAIVDTVTDGEPFVVENGARLQTIAWAVVGLELLHVVVGMLAARASAGGQRLDVAWSLSVTRLLAILLLFVLARVFDQGARMREEIAATI